MKKRKVIILLGVCLVLILAAFYYFRPMALISLPYTVSTNNTVRSKEDVSITFVSYNGGESVTEKIDKEALADILSEYTCRRMLSAPSSYATIKDAWEINLNQGGKPLYIVLGETACCYTSDNSVKWKIIDAESLTERMKSLCK